VGLQRFGLEPGEPIRFRRPDKARWQDGVATGVERDGSVAVADRDGSHRAVPVEHVLVRGRRRNSWEPLVDRAARTATQLQLF
jgi:hypothetical protein